jgi:hydroxymethylpyrimidine pyrophosphatase-like HAD family hydrolase
VLFNDSSFLLPESFSNFDIPQLHNLPDVCNYENIIVLYSGLSEPVAFDIETKFSESALGNVVLADYRKFACTRQIWPDRRREKTLVIALISPENASFAGETLALIPENVPVLRIETKSSGAKGMIELLLSSFELTRKAGVLPEPEAERRINHFGYSEKIVKESECNNVLPNRAIAKKCNLFNPGYLTLYKEHYFAFYNKLHSAKFKRLVFDYDDTLQDKFPSGDTENKIFELLNKFLANGITVAVATGRGESIRDDLQKKIRKECWDSFIFGYYNGGDIGLLSDNNPPDLKAEIYPPLQDFVNELARKLPNTRYDLKPKQLTVFLPELRMYGCENIVYELARRNNKIKIFTSGYTIDIIPFSSSKLNVVDYEGGTLCFGDSGQYGGNDFELLSHEYSLSVNRCSSDFNSCWNLAPTGMVNSRATLFYLNCMEIVDGFLKFNLEKGLLA